MIMKEVSRTSTLPTLRRGFHHLLDPLRPQAHLLLPRHQVLLRPRHLLGERSPSSRWTASSTSSRSSSTSSPTSPTPPPSSTVRSPSRCSSTRTAPAPTTAPASSRPSAASRCASSTSASPRRRSSPPLKSTALGAGVGLVGVSWRERRLDQRWVSCWRENPTRVLNLLLGELTTSCHKGVAAASWAATTLNGV